MKLLFDQNLSHRLVPRLGAHFPGSAHVREVHLEKAEDTAIWRFAKDGGFTIVTKDQRR